MNHHEVTEESNIYLKHTYCLNFVHFRLIHADTLVYSSIVL